MKYRVNLHSNTNSMRKSFEVNDKRNQRPLVQVNLEKQIVE